MPATEGSSLTPELHLSGAQSDLGLLAVLQLHLGRQTELTASRVTLHCSSCGNSES